MFDHNYDNEKVLHRIPEKVYKALNSKFGAAHFVVFVGTVERKYQNESDMQDLMT